LYSSGTVARNLCQKLQRCHASQHTLKVKENKENDNRVERYKFSFSVLVLNRGCPTVCFHLASSLLGALAPQGGAYFGGGELGGGVTSLARPNASTHLNIFQIALFFKFFNLGCFFCNRGCLNLPHFHFYAFTRGTKKCCHIL